MTLINKTFKYKCQWCGNHIERFPVEKKGIKVPPNAIKCRECGGFTPRMDFESLS